MAKKILFPVVKTKFHNRKISVHNCFILLAIMLVMRRVPNKIELVWCSLLFFFCFLNLRPVRFIIFLGDRRNIWVCEAVHTWTTTLLHTGLFFIAIIWRRFILFGNKHAGKMMDLFYYRAPVSHNTVSPDAQTRTLKLKWIIVLLLLLGSRLGSQLFPLIVYLTSHKAE